jgi:uncharacterized protein (DUF488 family)
MQLFTIGFTQKSAERFFGLLTDAGVKKVIDIRLHNTSQLAGFAKRDDLCFFLDAIGNIGYEHEPLLAPTEEIMNDYKKKRIKPDQFEARFLALMRERQIENELDPARFDRACLLCSEVKPEECHRHLVAEYLNDHWGNIDIVHLV